MRRHHVLTAVAVLVIPFIWVGWFLILLNSAAPPGVVAAAEPYATWGVFGDAFGVIGSLMATLAAASVVLTFRADAAERRAQAFEQNFFRLLNNFESIVSTTYISRMKEDETLPTTARYEPLKELERRVVDHDYKGRKTFNILVCFLRDKLAPTDYNNIKLVAQAYDRVFDDYVGLLGPFFRTLYHLVKLVDDSCTGDKYYYIRVVRSQLANSEMCLLAYNCCVGEGRFKFKPLVEKYSLLHNLHRTGLDAHASAELEFFQRKLNSNAFRFEPLVPVSYDD